MCPDVHLHHGDAGGATRVIGKYIMARQETLMDTTDRVLQDVEKKPTVGASMEQFIGNLKSQVAEALSGANLPPENAARLAAIFPALEGNAARITQAIVANTPGAPPAPAPLREHGSKPAPDHTTAPAPDHGTGATSGHAAARPDARISKAPSDT